MAGQIVKQPNGMYAQFCEIACDFTVYGMTREEAFQLCLGAGLKVTEAEQSMKLAERSPKRYAEAMQTVAKVHGADRWKKRERELQ